MKQAIQKYLEYLRSVRNSSPHTVLNYGKDLQQFAAYLSPPGVATPAVADVTHQMIREYSKKVPSHASLLLFALFSSFACAKAGSRKIPPASSLHRSCPSAFLPF